ncbi:MAG: cytochrome c [Hyphomicrobiales bacterium]|nr:cytochrome c [Hyphomicrobiales bacterium]
MRRLHFVLACLFLAGASLAWWLSAPQPRFSPAQWQALGLSGDADRGRLMFFAGGCESCHVTPGQTDPLRLGGGLKLRTPFGSFYPPNISSDRIDGIGAWSTVDLANALLSGVSPKSEHLYPAFPYTSYQRMTPSDVADLIAFLRTLPAVRGRPPAHRLHFPFSLRRGLGLWKLLYFNDAGLSPDPKQSALWNLGRYLVEGPGHCGECHTPRNLLGAMKPGLRLAGAAVPDGKGNAPNLTGGGPLANWTNADIVEALSSGFTPDGDVLGGGMTAVVRNLAQLPKSDLEAIATYLKSLPPIGEPSTAKP